MASKFGDAIAGEWEFRQFMTLHPVGDADPEITAKLRAAAAQAFPEPPRTKTWLSRFLGR